MNDNCLGWDCSVSTQTDFRGKNGILNFSGGRQLETFVRIFKGTVIVVLLINSPPTMNITSIVVNAFNNAGVPHP